jgi:hypothetical protein
MAGVGLLTPTKATAKRYIVHSDELLSAFLELEARLSGPDAGNSANLKF